MQMLYGVLLSIAVLFFFILAVLSKYWLKERKYPDIPKIVKSSHYIYGRVQWRQNPVRYWVDPVLNRKEFQIINWDEGIIRSPKIPLKVGDIIVVQGRNKKDIALMVIFDNGNYTYETAFIGVYIHESK